MADQTSGAEQMGTLTRVNAAPMTERGRRLTRHLRRDLRASMIDGTAYAIMLGLGENCFSLFVLAAGLSEAASGLVRTAPTLIGSVVQLASPWGARAMGGLRRWTVASAALQAGAFIPLGIMAFTGRVGAIPIFLAVTLYFTGGLCAGATWATWIGQMVPPRLRPRYFARRARPVQLGTLAGLVISALVLAWASRHGSGDAAHIPIAWYGGLFIAAGSMRAISARFLALQSDTGRVPDDHVHVTLVNFAKRLARDRDGRLIAFMMGMNLAAQIAEPFLPAYFKHLGMSDARVLGLIAIGFVARAFAQPIWGEIAHRIGVARVLWIGTLGLVPIAILWGLSDSFLALAGVQILFGAFAAAYDLGSLVLSLKHLRENERTSLWSQYQFGNAVVGLLGSVLAGAMLISGSAASRTVVSIGLPASFMGVFLLSSFARVLCVGLLARSHRPGRDSDREARAETAGIPPTPTDPPV
jgi:hypothetical protein